jgi:hypothetical protein
VELLLLDPPEATLTLGDPRLKHTNRSFGLAQLKVNPAFKMAKSDFEKLITYMTIFGIL